MDNFKPIFLIAVPQLADPNFAKSVILLIHHDSGGAVGLVINKTTDLKVGALARDQKLECADNLESLSVLQGGPVEPERCWLIHTEAGVEEKQVLMKELFLSGTNPTLKELLEKGQEPIRLVVGYAGWGAGQLEEEMAEGSWITADVNMKYIFETEPSSVWETILRDMGVDPNMIAEGKGVH